MRIVSSSGWIGFGRALAFLAALAAGACGDAGSTMGPGGSGVAGTWRSTSNQDIYLVITATTLDAWYGVGNCYARKSYEIRDRTGSVYTLGVPHTSRTTTLRIDRSGASLVVSESNGSRTETYASSDVDVSDLDECAELGGGGGDDVVCDTLPALAPDDTVVATLDDDDPSGESERRFDLYRLTVGAGAHVRVGLHSAAFDPLLILYDAAGDRLLSDDDGGDVDSSTDDDFDAALDVTLDAGCYRVEATSFAADRTGPYTLSVSID